MNGTSAGADPLDAASKRHVVRVELARIGSEWYAKLHGLSVPTLDFRRVMACNVRGKRIAAAYMAAPAFDPAALAAYEPFRRETKEQFDFLTRPTRRGGLGVDVQPSKVDPYPDAVAMTWDLLEYNRLKIYATGGPDNEHPRLTNGENDMFRAVH